MTSMLFGGMQFHSLLYWISFRFTMTCRRTLYSSFKQDSAFLFTRILSTHTHTNATYSWRQRWLYHLFGTTTAIWSPSNQNAITDQRGAEESCAELSPFLTRKFHMGFVSVCTFRVPTCSCLPLFTFPGNALEMRKHYMVISMKNVEYVIVNKAPV
jgi:hypothetical protein